MSKASKYLRKKLQEGGMISPEEAAKKAMEQLGETVSNEQPQFSPGIVLGGQVPQNRTQLPTQAQFMEIAKKSSDQPLTKADGNLLSASGQGMGKAQPIEGAPSTPVPPRGEVVLDEDGNKVFKPPITVGIPGRRLPGNTVSIPQPSQAEQATEQPQTAAAPAEISVDQRNWLAKNDSEYIEAMQRVRDSRGNDTEAVQKLREIEDAYVQSQKPSATITAGGVPTDGEGVADSVDTEVEDSEEETKTDKPISLRDPRRRVTTSTTEEGFVSRIGEPVVPEGNPITKPKKKRRRDGTYKYDDDDIIPYHKDRINNGWGAYENAQNYYNAEKNIYDTYIAKGKKIPKPTPPKKPDSLRPEPPGTEVARGGTPRYKMGEVGRYYQEMASSGWSKYDREYTEFQAHQSAYINQERVVGEKPIEPEEVKPTYPKPEPPPAGSSDTEISQYEIRLRNWTNENRAYLQYLEDYKVYEADLEIYNNPPEQTGGGNTQQPPSNEGGTGGGTNTQPNPPQNNTGDNMGTETNVTTGELTAVGTKDAPTDLSVRLRPEYETPEVEVAQLAEDRKVRRQDFPEGEAGTEQYKIARANEAQTLEAQGIERPRRSDFPEGEAGDIQYEAAIQRFRLTPIVAEGTITEDKNIQSVGEAGTITTEGVTADRITDAETAIQRKPDEVTAPEDVQAASMTAKTVGQEMPERPKASDYDRTTEEGRQKFSADLQEFDSKIERIRGYERPQPQDYPGGQTDPDFRAAIEAFRTDPLPLTKAVDAAQGTVSDAAQAAEFEGQTATTVDTAQRDAEAEAAAQADAIEYDASQDAYINKVTGEVATVEETAEAEAKTRSAITGQPAPDGEAAVIMSMYDYNQSQQRAIQGQKAKDKAIKQLKAQGVKDDDIAQQLADNPELIADQMEDLPDDVRTTLSGLPQEALVSVQMESLMAGMEDGEVPMWARPALAKVEANLAKRGMGRSSVGRDALFNAIIQSAIPLAQSNAAAIQQATAQDKQIAADFLAKNAGFQQQMELANLSNDQQMRLANLSAQNAASADNLNAAQQTELANLNARMQTNLLQGKIAAEMNQAQLNVDQQTAVQNATMVANIDMAKFNAAQQVELANSKFMQSMVQTQFNADQQAAMQNATMQASLDLATLDANGKLRAQNAQAFLQMDMANLSNEQQAAVLTAQQRQQALLSNQAAENAAAQFNAANEQQMTQFMANLATTIQQFNVQANAAREQFNATESNRIAAINAGNQLQADQFSAQLEADIAKFNEAQDFTRDQWNAANAQAVEQSNIQWRRQSNLADTAAQNAANQQNAQFTYNLTSQELSQVWQQLRDQAAYIRQAFENEEQRKTQLLATAIGNENIASKSETAAASWINKVID